MAAESEGWTWNDVVTVLRDKPIETVVQVPVSAIEEPANVGLLSLPTGADGRPVFGGQLDEQLGILVQAAGDNYEARLCRLPQQAVSPPPAPSPLLRQPMNVAPAAPAPAAPRRSAQQPPASVPVRVESRTELVVEHRRERSLASFIAERPGETLLLTTLLGTAIGAAFGGARGALAGAVAGGGAGLASVALSTSATSPVIAQISGTMFLALAANALGGRGGGPVLRLGPINQRALPPHLEADEQPRPRRASRKR